jgi:hypothetical protein
MKKLQPNKLDNYQLQVEQAIEHHSDESNFPRMEDYQVTKKSLDDYLFDYQSVLDSKGSQQSQLTVYGIIAFLPVLVCSIFDEEDLPWGSWSLVVAVLMGIVLALLVWTVVNAVRQAKLRRIRGNYPREAEYADAVRNFRQE